MAIYLGLCMHAGNSGLHKVIICVLMLSADDSQGQSEASCILKQAAERPGFLHIRHMCYSTL